MVTILPNGQCTPGLIRPTLDAKNNTEAAIDRLNNKTEATALQNARSSQTAEIMLFPNPNNGDFKLTFNNLQEKTVQIQITDVLGRQVFLNTYPINGQSELQLSVQNLSPGTYNLLLLGPNQSTAHKSFVVIH